MKDFWHTEGFTSRAVQEKAASFIVERGGTVTLHEHPQGHPCNDMCRVVKPSTEEKETCHDVS